MCAPWNVGRGRRLDLFEVGERGCARYFCLAQEFETGAGDRFLALGLLAVSPHRTLFFASVYDLTLAQLDALRMQKCVCAVVRVSCVVCVCGCACAVVRVAYAQIRC
jgi:hypothetical protein